jgi:pyruvate,orthophosphate dikinase
MGRPCVSGAGDLRIDYETQKLTVGGREIAAGETLTIDGTSGEVMFGEVPTRQPKLSGYFATLMTWVDEVRDLNVRTNAETPLDAETAVSFGAEGIGLCRTEHMFFDAERIVAVREMILAKDGDGRRAALAKILPMQRQDFAELFRIMAGKPVTIRLLDPPLHEFLPHTAEEMRQVADASGICAEDLRIRINELAEVNPMLGHRGCRLGVTYPEIPEMQARAIFEAAIEVSKGTGAPVEPEVMVPLVSDKMEFDLLRERIDAVAMTVFQETGSEVPYLVGTMIELPRAALRAGEIAEGAEFFSFGTNDLTQTTFGLSRDDTASLLKEYERRGIFGTDPFVSIDVDGVGELLKLGVARGRETRPGIKLGICGEHGGDPSSVHFCADIGLDYVSCSPYRVPVARLAAAQAALRIRR